MVITRWNALSTILRMLRVTGRFSPSIRVSLSLKTLQNLPPHLYMVIPQVSEITCELFLRSRFYFLTA